MSRGIVIFDLDGTLIDSAPEIHAIVNSILTEEGGTSLSEGQVRGFIGWGTDHFIGKAMGAAGLDPEDADLRGRITAAFLERYESQHENTKVYPGVVDTLELLATYGFAIGLCTNKATGPTRAVLAHFDLEARFDTVVCGDMVGVQKPDPAPLLKAAGDLGGGPVLYVGDSEVDAQTATAAGIPFALYTQGYRHAAVGDIEHHEAFDHFDKLPAVVARLLPPGTA
ncbi:phosphoglycolate phosphatase [Tropicimonas sp. IMCC34011]|uniref:phosphoglycolate phosphatase n=1 Tax=Tropicimonas sp. IMCC34011 TaxID=2248759 RepID=UPI000E227995|nr:phosphoglycolate phosphatase [Tropicimonas sp. IMCC34011]